MITTPNVENEIDMQSVDDVIRRAKDLLTEKKETITADQYQAEIAKADEEYRAYWNNVWKRCDKLGTAFSNRVKRKFHDEIDIDLDDAKRLLWDIIKELEPEFEFTDHNKPVINDLILYFTGNPKFSGDLSKGIYLYGKKGSGKTFLLTCFMAFAEQLQYRKFRSYFCEEVAMKLKSNIERIDDYTDYPAMFDDLMSEPKVNNYGDIIDTMSYILKVRYRKKIMTHGTSNHVEEDFGRIYDERVDSRSAAMFNFIYLGADKDYRKR